MRPVFIGKAHRALIRHVDVILLKSELQKPARVRAAKVDVRFAGCLFLEESVGLAVEITLDRRVNVIVALKASFSDARAYRRTDTLRSCAESAHFFDRCG